MESLLRWAIENSAPSTDPSAAAPSDASTTTSTSTALAPAPSNTTALTLTPSNPTALTFHPAPAPAPPQDPRTLDPALIELILGKPDAAKMRDALAAALDGARSVDARMGALDDLEMLVESLDNANDLEKLHMWPSLLALLAPDPTTPSALLAGALWVCGTAIQNNPQAQADFLAHDPLPLLLSAISITSTDGAHSAEARSRAVYALSGAVKHNAPAVVRMGELGGWEVLRDALADPDINVRRKVAFLINTLLLLDGPQPSASSPSSATPETGAGPESSAPPHPRAQKTFPAPTPSTSSTTRALIRSSGVLSALIASVHPAQRLPYGADGEGERDWDYVQRVGRCLGTWVGGGGGEGWEEGWTEGEKVELREVMRSEGREGLGLEEGEWARLSKSVQ